MSRDINLLHPELRAVCRQFLAECGRQGLRPGVSQTFRTRSEQEALYAQGRTEPGSIVTNAKYPLSPHCWGLAFDIYRNDGKGAYNDSDGWFAKCGAVGKGMGLFWGGDFRSFRDKPHFELKKYLPGNSCKTLIAKYGTPEAFISTWKELEEVTQQDFDKMMDDWLSRREGIGADAWALEAIKEAFEAGITDGQRPQAFATRQEVIAMLHRAGRQYQMQK